MATDWQTLEEAEDHAYFMAELVDISPESFTLEEKRKILDDMLEASSAIENRMRGNFAELDEVSSSTALERPATATETGGTGCSWTVPDIETSRPSRRQRPRIQQDAGAPLCRP